MKTNIKRRHHYVWQHYLQSFCHKENFVYCLMNDEIKSLHTKYVAVEKDLYRLNELSKDEISFILLLFMDKNNPIKNRSNETWVTIFNFIYQIKSSYPSGQVPKEIADKIAEAEHNLSENLHMDIENKGAVFIDSIKDGNVSFFDNEEDKANFLIYILVQFCRTRKVKDSFTKIDSKGHLDFGKAWNIIVYIVATNVGMTLFTEKENWELKVLNNQNSIPFITSDQPVINLYASEDNEHNKNLKHDDFELYYPISPSKSVVLKLKNKQYFDYSKIDIDMVQQLNKKIYDSRNIQTFSNSDIYLESISKKV